MGKYQLDYKGMQQVERYHEKNATVKNNKKARVQALLKKAGKKKLVSFNEVGHALGFLNLRLRLNDYLLEKGGHIGYSIRPSERGKGYAKESLRQGLQMAKKKNITRALITCNIENFASRAVILANGGQLENIHNETERYWIDLE